MKHLISLLLMVMCACSAVYSAEQPSKSWWPIDVEQNKRLDDHEIRLQRLEGGKRVSKTAVEEKKPTNTAICNCQGANKGVCYCLKSGVQCKCTATVGSIWDMTPEGKVIGKTGNYANPQTGQATAKPAVAIAAQVQLNTAQAQPRYEYQYQVICNGRRCIRQKVLVRVQ